MVDDLPAIDTESPEECLVLQVILGGLRIKFKMNGIREQGKPTVRFFADVRPEDVQRLKTEVRKFLVDRTHVEILGDKYEEFLRLQQLLFRDLMYHDVV